MSEKMSELLAQYPDSQRLAVLVGDGGVPMGLNVGQLTVLLARSEALYTSQARLSEAVKVLKSVCAIDAGRAEWHAARQFLSTLGEEND